MHRPIGPAYYDHYLSKGASTRTVYDRNGGHLSLPYPHIMCAFMCFLGCSRNVVIGKLWYAMSNDECDSGLQWRI